MAKSVYNFTVTMEDRLDSYYEEDIVKGLWANLAAFMTKRKGVNKGKIDLQDGLITIEWEYNYPELQDEDFYGDDYIE